MHSTVWSHTTHGTRSYVISRTGQWRPELGLLLPIGHIVILHIRSLSLWACVVWAHISTIPWPLSHINTAVELWGKNSVKCMLPDDFFGIQILQNSILAALCPTGGAYDTRRDPVSHSTPWCWGSLNTPIFLSLVFWDSVVDNPTAWCRWNLHCPKLL